MISVSTISDYQRSDEAIKLAEECFPRQRHFTDLTKLLADPLSREIFIIDHVQEDKLLAFLLIKFVKVNFWGTLINAGTIGFVSVKKNRQKEGFGASILAASENFAATKSCFILYLQGINDYYSRFGYIPQFGKSKMTFQTAHELQDDSIVLRNAQPNDLADLADLYHENSADTNCAVARTKEDWNWLLQSAKNTMFFDNPTIAFIGGKPIGYFCWDRYEPSRIREACSRNSFWGSSSLARGLINFSKQHGLKKLEIMCPQGSTLYRTLKTQYNCDFTQHFRVDGMQLIKICDENLAAKLLDKRLTKSGLKNFKTKPNQSLSNRHAFNLEIFENEIHIGTISHRHVGRLLTGELDFDTLLGSCFDASPSTLPEHQTQCKIGPFVYQGDNL